MGNPIYDIYDNNNNNCDKQCSAITPHTVKAEPKDKSDPNVSIF